MPDPALLGKPEVLVAATDRPRLDGRFWRELWAYREAFRVLVMRSIRVRYKQTAVGVAWVVLRPVLLVAVLTVVFGFLAGLRGQGPIPYTLLVLSGVLGWQFFASALAEAANSLVANAQIIGKVYCPRVLFPASVLASALIDLVVTLPLMIPLMLWYDYLPGWSLLALPFALLLLATITLGFGLWAAALNVRYRDFAILIPFALQIGFFASPVAYPLSVIPSTWQWLYQLNPMVGVLEFLRWCLLGGEAASNLSAGLAWSVLFAGVQLASGLYYFHRVERDFADIV